MNRAVHLAKTLLAGSVVYSGLLQLVQRLKRPRILVLAYHRVTPDEAMASCPYPAMHVSTTSFEKQLQALRRFYRVVPMSTLHAVLEGREPLREHVAVITFDDGYQDNYQHAFPILVRHDVPATFFLSLGFVDEHEISWFDRLSGAVQAWDHRAGGREALRAVLPAALVDAFDAPLPQVQRLREAAAFLKALPDEERQALMQRLLEELAPDPGESMAEPLRWDEVRRMRAQGMHIGAHGIRHAILTSMAPEEARRELAGSLEGVGRRIGAAVTEFAYPNGDVDEGVATLAREAGARLGFTMQAHENRPDHDPLRLARYNVCEDTSRSAFAQFSRAYFWCEITGVFDFVLRRESRRRSEGA